MFEILKAIRLVGLSHMWRLHKGYKDGWQDTLQGYFTTHALFALLNLGFLDDLVDHGSANPKDFAESHDLDPELLTSTCMALYRVNFFDRSGSSFSFSKKGSVAFDVLRGWLELGYGYDEIFVNLEDMIRRKRVYNQNIVRRPDYIATGSGTMEALLFFPIATDILKQGNYTHVMDLGCGDGTFLRGLSQNQPGIKATGIDLSPVAVADGNQKASQEGLSERVRLFALDISKITEVSDDIKGVQATTVFFVLHELLYSGEDRVIAFLKDYRRLFPTAPLIVFEAIRPADEAMRRKPGAAIYYHYFHDLSHQRPTNREHWRDLFAKGGFTSIEERYLQYAAASVFTLR